jgi:membrane glycosyltransferase
VAPRLADRASPTSALTPGVVAVLAPSTFALVADPATWRAIMLILLALGFMLLGARKMWKTLLGLGIADMAIVVVVVFATAQVSTTPWLITLLATGGLLLTLAVYAERRRNAATENPHGTSPPPHSDLAVAEDATHGPGTQTG